MSGKKPKTQGQKNTTPESASPISPAETKALAKTKAHLDRGERADAATLTLCRNRLHEAALAGHKSVAELLLANGANINATDTLGYTPLHCAAAGGTG